MYSPHRGKSTLIGRTPATGTNMDGKRIDNDDYRERLRSLVNAASHPLTSYPPKPRVRVH